MWTTKITNIQKGLLTFNFTVEFQKDGVLYSTHTFERVSEPSDVKKLVIDQLNQYKKIAEIEESSIIGDLDLTPVVEEVEVKVPTKEETNTREYFSNVEKLNKVKHAIALGMLSDTDEIYTELQEKVKTDFKPEYIEEL